MNHAEPVVPVDDDPAPAPMRMGSEYTDATTYLQRSPRKPAAMPRRKSPQDPRHGSNDSDFGFPEQRHE